MSNTPIRKLAFAFVVGSSALTAATLGIKAFSDVPRGMPFTHSQAAQMKTNEVNTSPNPGDQEILSRASRAFHEIAQGAMPAVVSISTIRRMRSPLSLAPRLPDMGESPTLSGPHGMRKPGENGRSQQIPGIKDPRMMGIGSGIIIRSSGLILTNNHVIEDAERVTVTFDEKHKMKAHVVGTDPKTDLAVVQLDGTRNDFPVIRFGNSDQIKEGDWAIAIGSPFGLNRSVTFGIISAKGRAQMGILDTEDFIQTDAAINPGSSGGPLLNASGDLVGVNTAIFSQGGGNMGIGFAIPSKIAKEISDEIIEKGHVSRGWVGLMAQDLDADLAKYFNVPAPQGALISEVLPSGPAGQATIQSGDVVTKFNQQPVDGASTLKSIVGKTKAGSKVAVELIREGKLQTFSLAVQEQPSLGLPPVTQQAGQVGVRRTKEAPPSLGLAVEDVPQEIARFLNLPSKKGTLVVGVNPGSPAFDAGIGPGDIILSANRADVHGAREFSRMSKDMRSHDMAVLYIQRGPSERVYVPVKLNDDES